MTMLGKGSVEKSRLLSGIARITVSSLSSGPSVVGTAPGRGWHVGNPFDREKFGRGRDPFVWEPMWPGTHVAGNPFDREWGYRESI